MIGKLDKIKRQMIDKNTINLGKFHTLYNGKIEFYTTSENYYSIVFDECEVTVTNYGIALECPYDKFETFNVNNWIKRVNEIIK